MVLVLQFLDPFGSGSLESDYLSLKPGSTISQLCGCGQATYFSELQFVHL